MFQEVCYQYFLHLTWSRCREHAGLELQMKPLLKKIQTSFGMSECPIRVVSIFPSGVGRDQLMNRLLWQHRASLSIDNLGSSGETLGCYSVCVLLMLCLNTAYKKKRKHLQMVLSRGLNRISAKLESADWSYGSFSGMSYPAERRSEVMFYSSTMLFAFDSAIRYIIYLKVKTFTTVALHRTLHCLWRMNTKISTGGLHYIYLKYNSRELSVGTCSAMAFPVHH